MIDGGIAIVSTAEAPRPSSAALEAWRTGLARHGGRCSERRAGAPDSQRVSLAHAGASAEVRVYTRREAELAALMPEKVAADTGKQLLCPMPGLVKAIASRPARR